MSGTSIIAQISMSLVCIYNDSELVRASEEGLLQK